MKSASILTIGDEILLGQIQDTNSTWLANALADFGIDVVLKISVGDSRSTILDAFQMCFDRSDVLFISGGLGPTKDDLTKPLLAEWTEDTLQLDELAFTHITELYKKRGREVNPMVQTQAYLPTRALYLHNEHGTAPGMWFSHKDKVVIALPGVPYELKQIVLQEAFPKLKMTFALDYIGHRFLRTVGVPETYLAQKIESIELSIPSHLKIAYLPGGGQVKLRITGRGAEKKQVDDELDTWAGKILNLIEDNVYSTSDIELEQVFYQSWLKHQPEIYMEDNITSGRLIGLLLSAGIPIEKLKTKVRTGSNQMPEENGVYFYISKETDSEEVKVEIRYRTLSGNLEDRKTIKPFPKLEIFQNMISLWSLEMGRKLLNTLNQKKMEG
jgi:nicotinamide-nucleotide amidase